MGALFLVFMITIAYFQVSSTVNQKQWHELAGFSVVWIIATAYGFLVIIGVNVPKPAMIIIEFFEGIFGHPGLR